MKAVGRPYPWIEEKPVWFFTKACEVVQGMAALTFAAALIACVGYISVLAIAAFFTSVAR